MKSCLSLLMMLVVVALALAGGYWLYTKAGGHTLSANDEGTTLTLQNDTSFGLTVDLKGPAIVQFAITPGKSQKRSIPPGTYDVKGRLSDPKTDGFGGTWKFEDGRQYSAGFTRSERGGSNELVGGLIRAAPAHP